MQTRRRGYRKPSGGRGGGWCVCGDGDGVLYSPPTVYCGQTTGLARGLERPDVTSETSTPSVARHR